MPREPLFTPSFLRLWSFAFITFLSAFQLFPAIPLHILELGGTKAQAGLFLAIYTYACAFSAPITGTLADAFGRKRVLIAASSSFVVFSLLYGIVPRWPLLLLVACIHGVCWSAILSSSSAISSEIIPASRRTEGLSYWGMASTGAIAVAPFVGLMIYNRFGWLRLCVEMALLSVGMILLALRLHDDPRHGVVQLPPLRELIDFRVIATALALFAVSFSYGGITSYVALLSADRDIQPRSLFFTLFAVAILVSRVIISPLGDRWGPRAILFPSFILVPLALVLLALSHSKASLVSAAILYGIGFGGTYPSFMAYVLRHTDEARRGATFGSVIWAFDTGIGSGSLIVGILIDAHGYTTAFLTTAVLSALSIPIFLFSARRLERNRAVGAEANS